jgi:type VI protein secretion system component VasK
MAMKAGQKRFELWHTIVTLFALNLSLNVLLMAVKILQEWVPEKNGVRIIAVAIIVAVLSVAAFIYLLSQLREQSILLVDKLRKKKS